MDCQPRAGINRAGSAKRCTVAERTDLCPWGELPLIGSVTHLVPKAWMDFRRKLSELVRFGRTPVARPKLVAQRPRRPWSSREFRRIFDGSDDACAISSCHCPLQRPFFLAANGGSLPRCSCAPAPRGREWLRFPRSCRDWEGTFALIDYVFQGEGKNRASATTARVWVSFSFWEQKMTRARRAGSPQRGGNPATVKMPPERTKRDGCPLESRVIATRRVRGTRDGAFGRRAELLRALRVSWQRPQSHLRQLGIVSARARRDETMRRPFQAGLRILARITENCTWHRRLHERDPRSSMTRTRGTCTINSATPRPGSLIQSKAAHVSMSSSGSDPRSAPLRLNQWSHQPILLTLGERSGIQTRARQIEIIATRSRHRRINTCSSLRPLARASHFDSNRVHSATSDTRYSALKTAVVRIEERLDER